LPGLVLHSPQLQAGDTKVIGEVSTVKVNPSTHHSNANSLYAMMTTIRRSCLDIGYFGVPTIDLSKADAGRAGTILFLSQPAGLHNAVFGGIMAHRSKLLGVEGVVIDGQLRDINYMRTLQLPVFDLNLQANSSRCLQKEYLSLALAQNAERGRPIHQKY